jgi:hypothetical protein
MINPISIDISLAYSKIAEVNMKLIDKLLERGIITEDQYDNELRKMADKADITYYKPYTDEPRYKKGK